MVGIVVEMQCENEDCGYLDEQVWDRDESDLDTMTSSEIEDTTLGLDYACPICGVLYTP